MLPHNDSVNVTGVPLNNQANSHNDEALKFWIEEYKSLTSDIGNRVSLQHGLLNFHIIIIVATLGFLATILREESSALFRDEVKLFVMVLPLITSMFVWRHLNHDINIIDKAIYIYRVIRPKVNALCETQELLSFEKFLELRRHERIQQFGILIWLGGEHFFHLFFSILFLTVAYAIFFLSPGEFVIANNVKEGLIFASQDILLVLSTIVFFATLKLRIKVAKAYGSIVSNLSPSSSLYP